MSDDWHMNKKRKKQIKWFALDSGQLNPRFISCFQKRELKYLASFVPFYNLFYLLKEKSLTKMNGTHLVIESYSNGFIVLSHS